jgi:signal transduction histidine kinase
MSSSRIRRVLIVDDTPEDRESVRRALLSDSTVRHQFVEAVTGAEAIALVKARTQTIDLAVFDWRLPDMSGLELAQALRGDKQIPPFPAILVTGSTQLDISREAMEVGIQDFFAKSLISGEIFSHIARNAIDRYRLMQRLVQSEQDARQARVRAEDANRAKSMFLSTMSHELRTPLTAVLGLTDLLIDNPQSSESQEMLEMIKSNGTHLANLLNDLLDLAKIEAGTVDVELVECDPLRLTVELCDLMRYRAHDENLILELRFDGKVPAQIHTDPVRLRQVLMNLISNAIKFTDEGGVRVKVCFRATPNPILEFDIRDTGVGIDDSQLERVFQPFVQVGEDLDRRASGAGLGLSISRSLARALGGDLTVKSVVGEGSIFTLQIAAPAAQRISDYDAGTYNAPAVTRPQTPAAVEGAWTSRRILIAEDTRANQFLLSRMLKPTLADLTFVETGTGAIQAVKTAAEAGQPFDIVLMDMQMPEKNGFEATRTLRAAGLQVPIIALTAAAMDGDRELCLDAGCNNYLSKPINRNELLQTIADLLASK